MAQKVGDSIMMIRKSIPLRPEMWQRLDQLAVATRSHYRGRPSWRAMIRRIASGELSVRPVRANTSPRR